ncbi:MAG: hypothetical protein K6F49_10770 [Saccharofermentans sp.]|nr:hypothetical protein [Saccharofermentans sp.]
MKNITKKIFTSAISAVISLTAVAAFTAPAAPVLAASNNRGQTYGYSYSYELDQYELKKQEGIRFLENCVTDPSRAAQYLILTYSGAIEVHPYDISKSYEQNCYELVRYVNNVYKNVIEADNNAKFNAYKKAKLDYIWNLSNCPEDDVLIEYVAYAFTYIVYTPGASVDDLYSQIDQLTAIAESGING